MIEHEKNPTKMECVCLFIFIIPADFIFSSSGSHYNNTLDAQEHVLFQQ